jgi:hypothetical protein
LQVIATKYIEAGEEILAPYGGQFARKIKKELVAKKRAKEIEELKTQELLNDQFYRAKGAAPRWHCKVCKRFVEKHKMKTHFLFCNKHK